jgi:hypothetical protein
MILLLTAGGTSLDAMHKKAPICLRSRRQKWSKLPLKASTVEKPNQISGHHAQKELMIKGKKQRENSLNDKY